MTSRATIGQVCKKCTKKNPKKAKYCMSCGYNMNSRSKKLWPGKTLSLKKRFDPRKVINAILAQVDPQFVRFDAKKVTEMDIQEALSCLTQKSRQTVIRLTGISGGQKAKSYQQVAEEIGVKAYSVKQTARLAFFHLALKLRELRPNTAVQKARKESAKEFKRILDQARRM